MFVFVMLSWIGLLVLMCFLILSIAAGLYYLAELVEEFTTTSAKCIRYLNYLVLATYCLLFLFENMPILLILCGVLSHINNILILRNFPFFKVTSLPFIGFILLLVVNHMLTFTYFSRMHFHFTQVLSYFTICLWLIPFCFFVSLSANDNILPTFIGNNEDEDLITNYFSKNKRSGGLLSFLKNTKESILPQRVKKSF